MSGGGIPFSADESRCGQESSKRDCPEMKKERYVELLIQTATALLTGDNEDASFINEDTALVAVQSASRIILAAVRTADKAQGTEILPF